MCSHPYDGLKSLLLKDKKGGGRNVLRLVLCNIIIIVQKKSWREREGGQREGKRGERVRGWRERERERERGKE